jgi:hypothetical protein
MMMMIFLMKGIFHVVFAQTVSATSLCGHAFYACVFLIEGSAKNIDKRHIKKTNTVESVFPNGVGYIVSYGVNLIPSKAAIVYGVALQLNRLF